MTIERFWEIIEQAGQDVETYDDQADKIVELLEKLEPEEIISFYEQLYKRLYEAYRWDLYGAAYIVYGGRCGDDSFEDFRCWLIAQGKVFFKAALRDPQKVSERIEDDEEIQFEALLTVAIAAYETKTGREMPLLDLVEPDDLQGERWERSDLEGLYPDLYARFLGS